MTTNHVLGAYLLARLSANLPKGVLTASACLADMAPDWWAIEWTNVDDEERNERARRLGVRAEEVPQLIRWVTDRFDHSVLWPNVFADVASAREFLHRFALTDAHLIGIALPADLVDGFLKLSAPPEQLPGYAPVGATGVHEVLSRRQPPARGGSRRGYEVLGYDGAGQFDSFRCNDLDTDFGRELHLTLNAWGLIDDEELARKCAAYANRPDVATCACAWHPWLVEEYLP